MALGRGITGSVGGYLPNSLTEMWEPSRDFAFLKLPTQGVSSVVALSATTPHVMVVTSEGYFYSYNIDLEHGGECVLMKRKSLTPTLSPSSSSERAKEKRRTDTLTPSALGIMQSIRCWTAMQRAPRLRRPTATAIEPVRCTVWHRPQRRTEWGRGIISKVTSTLRGCLWFRCGHVRARRRFARVRGSARRAV